MSIYYTSNNNNAEPKYLKTFLNLYKNEKQSKFTLKCTNWNGFLLHNIKHIIHYAVRDTYYIWH